MEGGCRAIDCADGGGIGSNAKVIPHVPPNTSTATGKDGVRQCCEPIFKQVKSTAVTVADRDVVVAGDWAIEHGNFDRTVAPVSGGPEQREQGRFVAIYRRQPDGSWKLARDIWNSALPLPSTPSR